MNKLLDSNFLGTFVLALVIFAMLYRGYSWTQKAKQGYGLKNFGLTENDLFISPGKATSQQKQRLAFYSKGMSLFGAVFLIAIVIFYILKVLS